MLGLVALVIQTHHPCRASPTRFTLPKKATKALQEQQRDTSSKFQNLIKINQTKQNIKKP
jgi:hypothetical protein